MYKFQSKTTLKEIEAVGTDAFGCINPIKGRLFLDAKEVKKVLEEMKERGEEIECMTFLDKGWQMLEKPGVFVSEFTITTNKEEHLCSNLNECRKRTHMLLLGLNLEVKDFIAGAA